MLRIVIGPYLEPSLKGALCSGKSFTENHQILSTGKFKANFPQGFNSHLMPLVYFAVVVLSHILALREPVLTYSCKKIDLLQKIFYSDKVNVNLVLFSISI